MKSFILTLVFLSIISFANAQNENAGPALAKFVRFYKANQTDSIYTLFSMQMKTAVNAEGTRQLITRIKSQLGDIVKSHYAGSPGYETDEYILSFQRPLVNLSLVIKDGQVAGIHQKQIEADKNDPVSLESPDNVSVNAPSCTLYGTLLMPDTTNKTLKTSGKVPVVLLIAGSGPTDRNMNQGMALRSNSFLMLSKALAANGIASVRYDKRSVGKSVSTQAQEDLKLDDYISDADLFITLLKGDQRFSKVIVAGHSEGALIGLVSSGHTNPAAFISLAGTANLEMTLKKQLKTNTTSADYKLATEIIDSLKAGKLFHRQLPAGLLTNLFNPMVQPFLISSLKYNPDSEISKLKIPTLIINGTTDLQVGTEDAKQLAAANPKAKLVLIKGMNHVLKSAPSDRTSNAKTYNNPQLPLHPGLVPAVTGFIKELP